MPAALAEGSAWVGLCCLDVAGRGAELKGGADQALGSSAQLGIKDVKPHSGGVQLP
jgi:hypothetical protein